jgi:transposase
MPKPCSLELRERVVDAVESGASRREAAEWFDVSPSSAIKWMQRRQATGSIAPSLEDELEAILRQNRPGVLSP